MGGLAPFRTLINTITYAAICKLICPTPIYRIHACRRKVTTLKSLFETTCPIEISWLRYKQHNFHAQGHADALSSRRVILTTQYGF